MAGLEVGESVLWPAQNNLKGLIVAIDPTPDDHMAWIRRRDESGDYYYHSVKVKELVCV